MVGFYPVCKWRRSGRTVLFCGTHPTADAADESARAAEIRHPEMRFTGRVVTVESAEEAFEMIKVGRI